MEPRPSKLNPVCAQPTEWWRNLKEIHTDPRCGVLSLRRWHRENTHEENIKMKKHDTIPTEPET